MSLTLLRCTPNSRENLWSAVLLIIGPQERSDSHNPASSGGQVRCDAESTADPPCAPPGRVGWLTETDRGREPV
jgi:hypothetical protein